MVKVWTREEGITEVVGVWGSRSNDLWTLDGSWPEGFEFTEEVTGEKWEEDDIVYRRIIPVGGGILVNSASPKQLLFEGLTDLTNDPALVSRCLNN